MVHVQYQTWHGSCWNGSNMERSGTKAVSEWYHFPLGPGPQGPPYESTGPLWRSRRTTTAWNSLRYRRRPCWSQPGALPT